MDGCADRMLERFGFESEVLALSVARPQPIPEDVSR
jgi:hypothetical protein